MDLSRRIVRIPGYRGTAARGDALKRSPDSYVMREDVAFPAGCTHSSRDDETAMMSKLNALSCKYAQFQRSIVGCVFAMDSGISAPVWASTPAPRQSSSLSPSAGLAPASAADRGRMSPAGRAGPSAASTSSVPDLESCWAETSPLPPTAVLAALYGMTPLHGIFWRGSNGNGLDAGADENTCTGTTLDADSLGGAGSSTSSFELRWSLCRCAADALATPGRYRVTFRDAFTMTTVAAHMTSVIADGDSSSCHGAASLAPPWTSSSSKSSYSLAQQLRRASALLGVDRDGSPLTAPAAVAPTSSLLDWPEEFLWSLLVSLLSSLALVHSAGLHLFGQISAADVLCVACSPTLPRQLEQTWADVAAAAAAATGKEDLRKAECSTVCSGSTCDGCVQVREDADAIFRRFCETAVPSVLLPQATVTAATPCHHVFFVLHPSPELLQQRERDGCAHASRQDVPSLSAAQESELSTPAQQAQHQGADLASVGRLMSLLMELRARWCQRRRGHADPAAVPSSELAFLVRRLGECGGTSAGAAAATQNPTALQLLQLQALRLRTESWYYRRLAEEACDRLSLAPRRMESAGSAALRPFSATLPHAREQHAERQRREAQLAEREAQLAEREAKLKVMLELYELTHEHLDALTLPQLSSAKERANMAVLPNALPSHAGEAGALVAPSASTGPNGGTCDADDVGEKQQRASQAPHEYPLDCRRIPTLLPQQHQLANTAATRLAEVPAADGATAAYDHNGGPPRPQAATPSVSVAPAMAGAGAPHDDAVLGLSALARGAIAGGKPLSANAAAPPMMAETSPVLTTHRHLDAEELSGGGAAALARAAAAGGNGDGASNVVIVEVDVDATEDEGFGLGVENQEAARSTAMHRAPAGGFGGRAARAWTATTTSPSASLSLSTAAMLRQGPHGSPQPASQQQRQQRPLVSPSLHASPFQDMHTPMRSLALPNMGYVDSAAAGTAAYPGVGTNGGGSRSYSKYSALSLLRTPPSARRAVAAAAVATKATPHFRSPSLHSPESYPSSTRPHSAGTADISASAAAALSPYGATERSPPQLRHRRRSSSRGSSINHGGAHVVAFGGRSPRTEDHHQQRNDDAAAWAHQQLAALVEMQTALRAQQPPTPRSRASAAAATSSCSPEMMAAPAFTRSPATPPLASRVGPRGNSMSLPASSEVTPIRGTEPSHHDDSSAEMFRVESSHMRSSDSRSGARHGSGWCGSASAGRDFGRAITAERPQVLLSFTPPHSAPPASSPSIFQTPAATATATEGGASLSYAAPGFAAARDGATVQQAPPAAQYRTATALRGASHGLASSTSPPMRTCATGDSTARATRRGSISSGASHAFPVRGAAARANGAADWHQRSPSQPATSSPATVSTVRAATSALSTSAGVSSQGSGGRSAHCSLSSRTAPARATGHSAGGASSRGTVMRSSSSRISGDPGDSADLGRGTTGGGPLQRLCDAYVPSSSASLAHAGGSRASSTTAVELLRRLRASAGA
ncbi:hypothetical protein LSCM1_07970 [Leishmania martiniquensis]|uniref:Uncharacterized protein n=1 Tax=Leishmania martiniquensis TaxID=1580590 RepID=A0A836HYJ4_9TRYP|nr:hypothetical protein LSCM1_07970 [Leishmania martiniquensis]